MVEHYYDLTGEAMEELEDLILRALGPYLKTKGLRGRSLDVRLETTALSFIRSTH